MTDKPEGLRNPSGGWFPPVKINNPYEVGDPFLAFFNNFGAVVGLLSADLAAFLWYADTGSAAQGALIGYIAGKAGTDPFGNNFAQGTSLTGSGMANPMTAAKQMIIGGTGGTPQALPAPAADGQFLGQQSGAVGWYAAGGGMANPMNAKGAMIYSADGAGTPAELLMGTPAQIIGNVGGLPAWVTLATGAAVLPFVVLMPTGDATGTLDYNAFVAAQNSLPNGGIIFLGPGVFYTKNQWAVKMDTGQNPVQSRKGNPVCLQGSPATTVCGVGTFLTGVIYYHRDQGYGAQYNSPADPAGGFIRDIVIDGTYATGNSVGLDVGDARGIHIEGVTCQNFNGAGQVGCQIINRLAWTEKSWFQLELYNNAIAALLTTIVSSDHSNEFNDYDFTIFCNQNQQGIVSDSVNQGKSDIRVKGNMCQTTATSYPFTATNANPCVFTAAGSSYANGTQVSLSGTVPTGFTAGTLYYVVNATANTFQLSATSGGAAIASSSAGSGTVTPVPTGNVAALSIIKTFSGSPESRWYFGTILLGVEGNLTSQFPTGNVYPYGLYSDGTGYVKGCAGHIAGSLTNSVLNGAEFTCTGGFPGDPGLSQLAPTAAGGTSASSPAFPGFGVAMANTGPDQLVCVSGGGTTGITVNGQATGLTSGAFFVRAGGSLTVNGAGAAPTVYTWIGAGQMSN